MYFKTTMLSAAMAVSFAVPAGAAVITTLYNTGVDNAHVSVTGVGNADQHWSLGIESAAYVSGQNGVFPIGPWLAEDATSRWVTPSPTAADSFDPTVAGIYTYTLHFSLDGYKPGTAALSGRFAADNEVTGITLNGQTITGSGGSFTSWTAFNASGAAFQSGLNTLSFTVKNYASASGNPTGLRVELGGTAAVPEPQSWMLLIAGFTMVGVASRRRSKPVAA